MNRYSALGAVVDMLDGKQVLVLSSSMATAHEALKEVADVAQKDPDVAPLGVHIVRASGHERIKGDRGSITFRSVRASLRGFAFDVVYLDVDTYTVGEEKLFEITHLVARRGEVIHR